MKDKLKHLKKYHNITLLGYQFFLNGFGFYKKPFKNGLKRIFEWQMQIGWLTINKWKV